jgi:hypothetical protein
MRRGFAVEESLQVHSLPLRRGPDRTCLHIGYYVAIKILSPTISKTPQYPGRAAFVVSREQHRLTTSSTSLKAITAVFLPAPPTHRKPHSLDTLPCHPYKRCSSHTPEAPAHSSLSNPDPGYSQTTSKCHRNILSLILPSHSQGLLRTLPRITTGNDDRTLVIPCI